MAIVLRGDPYSGAAGDLVEEIRDKLQEVAPSALLGGIPAENYDVEQANARDTKLIVPVVLLVVGLILALVLRALAAPAYLTLTVVASFAATLGPGHLRLHRALRRRRARLQPRPALLHLPRRPGGRLQHLPDDPRPRGGGRSAAPARGCCTALESTGGVVTGAGLILAGTFATLTLLPLEELVQIGATVAIGVLLDTFVVRALLIPAITYLCGERAWWPSSSREPAKTRPIGE